MRQLSIAAIAAVSAVAFTQTASAADLPRKAPPPSPPPAVYNWTGWYIGLNAGGNWGKSHNLMTISGADPLFAVEYNPAGSFGLSTDGFTGGVQGGYNWQVGNFLFGGELDFEYFRSVGSQSVTFPTPTAPAFTSTIAKSLSTDWLFTARPRLGFVSGNWLFYGTGGLAVTQLKASWTYFDTFPEASNASLSTTKVGWTAGGGIETALPGNWSIGGEYLYVKFSSVSTTAGFTTNGNPIAGVVGTNSADLAANIVRFRLNKKL